MNYPDRVFTKNTSWGGGYKIEKTIANKTWDRVASMVIFGNQSTINGSSARV